MRNKFKAYNQSLKIMSEPFTLQTLCDRIENLDWWSYYWFSFSKWYYEKHNTEVDDVIFLQFTWAKDSKWIEICEWDIIQKITYHRFWKEAIYINTYKVVFTELWYDWWWGWCTWFYITHDKHFKDWDYIDLLYGNSMQDFTIIWNIYEHPEMANELLWSKELI